MDLIPFRSIQTMRSVPAPEVNLTYMPLGLYFWSKVKSLKHWKHGDWDLGSNIFAGQICFFQASVLVSGDMASACFPAALQPPAIALEHHGSELKIDSLHPAVLWIISHQVELFHLAMSWLLRAGATAQIFLTATHTTNMIHPSKCKVGIRLIASESCHRSAWFGFSTDFAQLDFIRRPAKVSWNHFHSTSVISIFQIMSNRFNKHFTRCGREY